MSTEKIGFDDLPDSKQIKTLDKAGVQRNYILSAAEYKPKEFKKEKKKNDKGEMEEVVTDKTVGPFVRLTFQCQDKEDPVQFVTTIFAPPTKAEEIKFHGDHYENGVAVRKNTDSEQIHTEFKRKFYLYEQLAKGLGVSPAKFLEYKKAIAGEPEILFKKMFDTFFSMVPIDRIKDKPLDIKTLWNNNDKAKTSFLQLADSGANAVAIAMHIPNRETFLSISPFEQKKLVRKYSNTDRAPKSDSTEAGGIGSDNSWKPIEEPGEPTSTASATGSDDDALF